MDPKGKELTHIAGTFLIQADGAFLNGAGLGPGEDRNVTVPKTFRDGRNEIPYVSAQAWRRWLRNTVIEEAGWPASELKAIGWNPKGNVNKTAPNLNPVDFPEDDIFGYMHAQEGQGRRRSSEDAFEGAEEEQEQKIRAVIRASPFAASLLTSIRSTDWKGEDEGSVYPTKFDPIALAEAEVERFLAAVLAKSDKRDTWKKLQQYDKELYALVKAESEKGDLDELRSLLALRAKKEGKEDVRFIENATSPLRYATRFYNTHLQAIFCLDYSRLGVFWNRGDRVELEHANVKRFLDEGKLEDVTALGEYEHVRKEKGRVYRLTDHVAIRKQRASELFKALAVLRGGAKQAQFGTDIAPKAFVVAGLSCGNPIFNHLFRNEPDGPALKLETFKEILRDYSDRIVTPVLVGIRTGYLKNEEDIRLLDPTFKAKNEGNQTDSVAVESDNAPPAKTGNGENRTIVKVMTPIEVAKRIGDLLP